MKNRLYYIDLIESRVWGYNKYWDKEPTNSELRINTKDTVEKIISYCTILLNSQNRIKENFQDNPDDIKMIAHQMYELCNDGVDRRLPVWNESETRSISHIDENGLISIERDINNPRIIDGIKEYAKELKTIIKSEEETVDFSKFLGKILCFEGYEYGYYSVLFDKISKNNKGEFTYDGVVTIFATPDSEIYADGGVVVRNVEDEKICNLPYGHNTENNPKEVMRFLESVPQQTPEELKEDVMKYMKRVYEFTDMRHILKKHKNK